MKSNDDDNLLDGYEITAVSRDDLEQRGFDTSKVSDETMRQLAKKMCDDYLNNFYWDSLDAIAEELNIPAKDEGPDDWKERAFDVLADKFPDADRENIEDFIFDDWQNMALDVVNIKNFKEKYIDKTK